MELKTYVRILKHRWVAAVVGLLLLFGVSFAVSTLSQVPTYRSEGQFSIKRVPGRVIEKDPIPMKPLGSRMKAMTSREVLEKTQKRLKKKEGLDLSISEIKQSIRYDRSNLIVNVYATHRNRDIPDKLLTHLFEVFRTHDRRDRTGHLQEKREELQEQIDQITKKLEEEIKPELNRRTESLADELSILVKKDPKTVIDRLENEKNRLYNRRHKLESRREQLKEKLNTIEEFRRQAGRTMDSGSTSGIPWNKMKELGLDEDYELSVLIDKYQKFRTKKQSLLIKYTDQHPKIQSLNKRLSWIRNELVSSYKTEPLQRKHNEVMEQISQVNTAISKNKNELKTRTDQLADMKDLQNLIREKRQFEDQKASLTEKKEEISDRLARKGKYMEWDREPSEPERATSSQKMNNLLISLAFGLVGAVGSAYLVEYFSSIIRRPKDVRLYFGINPIASVPKIREDNILDLDPSSDFPARELFNKLAVFFDSMSLELNSSTFLITSSRSGEGKSVLCANIGISLARSGENVLLVDSDFRKPIFHKKFNVRRGPGFTDFLKKYEGVEDPQFDVDEVIDSYTQQTSVPGLSVLSAGQSTDNPLSLLKSEACQKVFRNLRDSDFIVLCDSPPIGTLVDGAVVAGYVSGTILVVAEGEVQRTEAARVKHTLNQVGANTIGAIINKVELEPEEYYYYYRYYQGGKYGY